MELKHSVYFSELFHLLKLAYLLVGRESVCATAPSTQLPFFTNQVKPLQHKESVLLSLLVVIYAASKTKRRGTSCQPESFSFVSLQTEWLWPQPG